MSLDHGIINTPLSKRGDIDAQLDKYKAEQAKAKRRKFDDIKFLNGERLAAEKIEFDNLKDEAWHWYKKESKAMIDKYGNKLPHKFGSNQNCRNFLKDMAKYEPQVFLNILAAYKRGLEL